MLSQTKAHTQIFHQGMLSIYVGQICVQMLYLRPVTARSRCLNDAQRIDGQVTTSINILLSVGELRLRNAKIASPSCKLWGGGYHSQ
jgi:hypothetical protein